MDRAGSPVVDILRVSSESSADRITGSNRWSTVVGWESSAIRASRVPRSGVRNFAHRFPSVPKPPSDVFTQNAANDAGTVSPASIANVAQT